MFAISLPAALIFWFGGPRDERAPGRADNNPGLGRVSNEPRSALFVLPESILARIHVRDEAAFREVWRIAGPHLLRYASVFVDSPTAAEDVVQEVMLLLWKQSESVTPRGTLADWLLAAVRNVARNTRRNTNIAYDSAQSLNRNRRHGTTKANSVGRPLGIGRYSIFPSASSTMPLSAGILGRAPNTMLVRKTSVA